MTPNWIAILVAGIIPMIIGALYYHPKVFGKAWMDASGVTEEQVQTGNMFKIFGLAFLFSIMIALILQTMVIHQMHIGSLLMNEPGFGDETSEVGVLMSDLMDKYGDNFRTFKHGAFHGALVSILFALPLIGILGLFERKSGKYIFVHFGYWLITLVLMGGLLSAWQ